MLIVDAQIHLWTNNRAPQHHWRSPFTIERAVADMVEAGVDRAVNCPAIWDDGANDYAVKASLEHPERFATLGWFDITRPPEEGLVARFVSQPGMKGLRFVLVSPAAQELLISGKLEWIWEQADELGLPVGLIVPPQLYAEIGRIAGRFPRMRLLVDHMGVGPSTKAPQASEQIGGVLALARFPNVAVKATGAPSMATDEYPFESIHPILRQAFDAFGPRRMFWGTDYTRMTCSWAQCIGIFTGELDWLSGEDLEWVMGRGVCEWIGWTP
ncbi:putative TIM-barrel fold metal-dependent hydrolase [Neorhizobium galegae]|uniref:amidohydrolase family protein n=1 Tax=Neorhizobium galegae TaxID=399 RepID=UPI002783B4E2|nr:amidohydrolase family protein [Neorhizobium galegae]MDQ0137757.1 putative TIM-barrel fold metal-dependent hydrolase [Neorhizobium galegae]